MSSSSSLTTKPAPAVATQAGAEDPSGNLQPLLVDNSGNLKVSGTFTGSSASVGPTGSAVPADADYIGGKGPTGNLTGVSVDASGNVNANVSGSVTVSGTVAATQSGTWDINNVSGTVSLPTGASTSANQTNGGQKTQITNSSGSAVTIKDLSVQVASGDLGLVVKSVIHGLTTAGGGSYVDVKVNPSGALAVDASGSTGLVLAAGTAIVGKVGIDQTTPGTTNGVQVNAALPAGANTIGNVGLVAGSALVGKVGIDQTTPGTTNAVAVAQIGANTVLTGNGVTGTGSQRVTIASDNTAFTVNNQVIGQSGSTNANSSLASTALEASHVIKAGAGRLFQLTGVNTKSSAQYIQVFNSTTVPADTAVPVLLAYVPANANFSFDFGSIGRYFSTGIAVSNSSTAATKTIGSADCWFNAEYL